MKEEAEKLLHSEILVVIPAIMCDWKLSESFQRYLEDVCGIHYSCEIWVFQYSRRHTCECIT
jgi:hypothetical protein